MAKKYENKYKVMIVGLLNSGIKPKQITEDYGLDSSLEKGICS
jgi:transposase